MGGVKHSGGSDIRKHVQAHFAQFLQGCTDVALPHVPSHRASLSRGLRKLVLPPHSSVCHGLGGTGAWTRLSSASKSFLPSSHNCLPSPAFPTVKAPPQIQVWAVPANEGHELCLYPVAPSLSSSPINWTSFHSHSEPQPQPIYVRGSHL